MGFLANAVNYGLICLNIDEMVFRGKYEIDVFARAALLPLLSS